MKSTPYHPALVDPRPQVCLEIVSGKAEKRVREVRGEVFQIGSSADAELILADPALPSVVAYITQSERGAFLHATLDPPPRVNGIAVGRPHLLSEGDLIQIGRFAFCVRISPEKAGLVFATGQNRPRGVSAIAHARGCWESQQLCRAVRLALRRRAAG